MPLATYRASDPSHNDRTIRQIFDSQPFWNDFRSKAASIRGTRRAGLLQNKYLTSPAGFQAFSQNALSKCQKIVAKVLAAKTRSQYRGIVRDLDRLSDQLCRVIDLVDFVRNVHPDPQIQQAASIAHAQMFEYMNVLNTTQGLHEQLAKADADEEVVASWSEEEKVTARILLKDFAQSASEGSDVQRARFVELSNEVVTMGNEMVENMAPEHMTLTFASSKLKGMDPTVVKRLTRWGTTTIPTHGKYAALALRTVDDSEVRREIYTAHRTASRGSIKRVERLVRARAELARLSGHESFAHMSLSDKMAGTPEAVNKFLESLAADNKAQLNTDLAELLEVKLSDARQPTYPEGINAWDRDYYVNRIRSVRAFSSRPPDKLSQYFSVGTVMQGLSRLFNRLYGISLVPRETAPGETWADDVRRLDVMDDDTGNHIAVIYCDLFERAGKSPNPAHFTLRCSREITAEEVAETAPQLSPAQSADLDVLAAELNDGMALSRDTPASTSLRQLPTIGFICDFPRPSTTSSRPATLSLRELTTLFHEMGHCLHSVLGRTKLQNVAGTRCATDFAELPSVLMEHFAASPQVLSMYARHWETDEPLNTALVGEEMQRRRKLAAPAETEAQILLSVLDQRLHGTDVPPTGLAGEKQLWDSKDTYHKVWNDPRFASVGEPAGAAWHGFFGHLFGYGAVYYAYLFDRAIAGKIWGDVFEGGARALDRERGQRYRDEVLKWGGGRDGWACVAGVLGQKHSWMRTGGEEAMKEVGKWGASEGGDF
ncbi:hypothetical protein FH972_022604 [Carpinus fangiana]|uniref:Peptidase M3A/M3B catalytic domain-containing protein n=1 Tax=Carpinus fangiana TaxID=176857 RepID=A0A5N6KT21_9ROSI|nr:hypothetical protein FH972_022604 [Carpinus fangiana]